MRVALSVTAAMSSPCAQLQPSRMSAISRLSPRAMSFWKRRAAKSAAQPAKTS